MVERVFHRYGVRLDVTPQAMTVLEHYSWPGNARELANLIERLAVMRPNGQVDADSLPWPLRPAPQLPADAPVLCNRPDAAGLPAGGLDLKEYLADLERDMIRSALERADGVVQQAADELGVRRTTLVEKINRHKLRSNG
jgi:sigma-54 specific flagellar transcriptional regulator A